MSNRYKAVLFDWSGTLAADPGLHHRILFSLDKVGRRYDDETVRTLIANFETARSLPQVVEALVDEDTSQERHRSANMLLLKLAGFDSELADVFYDFDFDPDNRPLYPDVLPMFQRLDELGVLIGIVSDIHFDLRINMKSQGVGRFINDYILSWEHGVEKPDPKLFRFAIKRLDVEASQTLMVGDRTERDGGASSIGIDSLILPNPPPHEIPRGLDVVVQMMKRVS